jgi:hypothetical protein
MAAIEEHFTVKQVAEMWKVSAKTVRRLFSDEPGVLKLGEGERRYKRQYFTLFIPKSVLLRVHEKNRNR